MAWLFISFIGFLELSSSINNFFARSKVNKGTRCEKQSLEDRTLIKAREISHGLRNSCILVSRYWKLFYSYKVERKLMMWMEKIMMYISMSIEETWNKLFSMKFIHTKIAKNVTNSKMICHLCDSCNFHAFFHFTLLWIRIFWPV